MISRYQLVLAILFAVYLVMAVATEEGGAEGEAEGEPEPPTEAVSELFSSRHRLDRVKYILLGSS